VWDEASRRVTGFEIISREELGRPRIDVTLRISGFFRDAFPHVIALMDDAITAVAELDEPDNHLRAHALEDARAHGDWRRATSRIFGSKPGAYGAGLLPLIDSRNWRDDGDLAESTPSGAATRTAATWTGARRVPTWRRRSSGSRSRRRTRTPASTTSSTPTTTSSTTAAWSRWSAR